MIPEYAAEPVNTESIKDKDFRDIGIYSFFDTEEDSRVDWEDVFGINEKRVK